MAMITSNENSKAFPVRWVLMTNKSEESYLKAFQFLFTNFSTFQPSTSLTDHELAMRNSIKKVFPSITTRTCYFHYSQALVKNARDKKIISSSSSKFSNPEIFYVINQLKFLALLPAQSITPTYNAVKKEVIEKFSDFFNAYLLYYEDQWIKTEGPLQISNFRRVQDRTINIIESYHSRLNKMMDKHPNCNQFLATMIMMLKEMRIDLKLLNEGKYKPSPPKPQTVKNNLEYEEFSEKIELEIAKNGTDEINLIDTLKNLSYLKDVEKEEEKQIIKMIRNVKSEADEEIEHEKYTVYEIISNPENPLTTIALLTYIRRKLIASSDEGVVFILHHKPTVSVNVQ
ncbi:uncharacterized protein LOC141528971 [Cotesia typhae]|uniref:uncharacterized protein LOC141528971 n=1 Tax=Cotesia typhae TaxID=2053667 RepID=UPI003D681E99